MSIVPAGEPQRAAVSRRLGRRSIPALVVALILIGIAVPPFINVSRYRARIADAISRSLGRPVALGGISLRLLPQPGFDLANLVVGDDPAFSYEPILRADEVTASLRLSSLWRGQLEIARLRLKYPSLNLVRNADGQWNLESLLWRASRTETAPTMAAPQRRPRFPYIEAESGRINFKFGQEKTAFALTEADFKLWSPPMITCRTVVSRVNGHRRKVQKCTGRLVSGTIKFKTAARRATVSRGRIVYATGVSIPLGRGMMQLLLADLRPIRRGRYTLTERAGHGRQVSTWRTTLAID